MRLTRVTLAFISLIIAAGFYLLIEFLLDDLESQTLQATEESMVDTANLLAQFVENDLDLAAGFQGLDQRPLNAQIHSITKTKPGLQAYLTDQKGTVLFDSGNPANLGQNFSHWNDVARTLKGQYGARSTRTTESDDRSSILHVGAPIRKNNQIIGCLTVYKAQRDVLPFVSSRRQLIVGSTALIGTGIIALIVAVFVWLFRPIGRLTDYARAVARGEKPPRPNLGQGREVNTLATALREMREALDGRRYTEHYLHTLTHELKSPLAAIQGAAELLREDMNPTDRQRFLENIHTQTKRCESLIHQILELSAIECLSHLENSTPFDLTQCARDALQSFASLAETSQVSLVADLPSSLTLHGNEPLISSALKHLIQNALQFSPPNTQITLTATQSQQNALLTITDQGEGIPDFAAARAFERFFSYHPQKNTRHQGNGIGLALVKEVADLHHGQVTIARQLPHGTRCTLSFPLTPPQPY